MLSTGGVVVVLAASVVVVGSVDRGATDSGLTGAPSTTATTQTEVRRVDLAQPFAGTAAAGWQDGAAGVVVPVPTPLAGFSAEQVAGALTQVRDVLITARLDPEVLYGHDLDRLAARFSERDRADVHTNKGYRTAIAPGSTLLGVPAKVAGTMTAKAGRPGELLVDTSYAFAYAFRPPDPERVNDPLHIISVVRVRTQYGFYDDRWDATGLTALDWSSYSYSVDCAAAEAGFLAPSLGKGGKPDLDAGDAERDAFDPAAPMATESTC
ncbi:hypothetical protein [Actinokineospora bangkokensis]|uniref:Uncharacterized protein n=1 Tax=Actinokineospora bangkokensis TaxID=1193682 RepID=A0A1Q9LNK4_9PSEU|nr:hypothetical protein [Actinokineospora bangkokensis]OLR93595.1 hypothetical protein BJP25_15035 [Actinokineospora bangkokensis]